MIEEFIKQNKKYCKRIIIGLSENEQQIYALNFKKGKGQRKKALLISYLHGDENDTINTNKKVLQNILHKDLLDSWEIKSIPIANPDGKKLQKRCNAKGIDLNRDFIKKKAKETKIITKLYQKFKPEIVLDYHQNLDNGCSGILLPPGIKDYKLLKDIIFLYDQIREESHLFQVRYLHSQDEIIAGFLDKGIYRLYKNVGSLINYASKRSKIAVTIEDRNNELSVEVSTELLKHYNEF